MTDWQSLLIYVFGFLAGALFGAFGIIALLKHLGIIQPPKSGDFPTDSD